MQLHGQAEKSVTATEPSAGSTSSMSQFQVEEGALMPFTVDERVTVFVSPSLLKRTTLSDEEGLDVTALCSWYVPPLPSPSSPSFSSSASLNRLEEVKIVFERLRFVNVRVEP